MSSWILLRTNGSRLSHVRLDVPSSFTLLSSIGDSFPRAPTRVSLLLLNVGRLVAVCPQFPLLLRIPRGLLSSVEEVLLCASFKDQTTSTSKLPDNVDVKVKGYCQRPRG